TPTAAAQGILTQWDAATRTGYAVVIGDDGALAVWVGDGTRMREYSTPTPMRPFTWYEVSATIDEGAGVVQLHQRPLKLWPLESTENQTTHDLAFSPSAAPAPFIMGAWC